MRNLTHIKNKMREMNNTEARPEETRLAKQLTRFYPNDKIETQYIIKKGGVIIAVPDIVNFTKKTCYFCNGPYHESRTQTMKDRSQYNMLKSIGWKVIVLWFYDGFKKEHVV